LFVACEDLSAAAWRVDFQSLEVAARRPAMKTMPKPLTPSKLAERICRRLELPADRYRETLEGLLREAVAEARDASVSATKAACLEVAEEEAERCRAAGATAAQQTALIIASRIRKRHVEVRS